MAERWLPVPGWERRYEVSDEGRVRSLVSRRAPFIMSPARMPNGYFVVTLCAGGEQEKWLVSRIVLLAFVGPPPTPDCEAAHDDGDNGNNCLSNLAWKTPLENAADKYRHGTVLFGERHQNAKLTEEIVKRIRFGRVAAYSFARQIGVSPSLVYQIKRGKGWPHVRAEGGPTP